MGYPAGNGSERLMYSADVMNAAATDDMLVAAADTTILVKSIVLCELGNGTESFAILVNDGADHYLCSQQTLTPRDTYVWNDIFVFGKTGGSSTLKLTTDSSATIHWYVTYILQDWT